MHLCQVATHSKLPYQITILTSWELISKSLLILSTSPPGSLIIPLSWLKDGGVRLTGFKLVSVFIPLTDYVHLLNSALNSLGPF